MEVPLLVEVDTATVKHEEDYPVQDSTLMRRDQAAGGGRRDNTHSDTEVTGCDCDTKQRKGSNRVDVLRKKSRQQREAEEGQL
ncbi:hypothetical protein BHE74_00019184 [Ensete ventricosum]|nr:hypothetical protein BHE74_00019184 [Ensete ventricosum]